MKSHIINGHYMFGNTFIQPEMYRYNKIRHHYMAPAKRPMPPYPDMINRPIQCPNAGAAVKGSGVWRDLRCRSANRGRSHCGNDGCRAVSRWSVEVI